MQYIKNLFSLIILSLLFIPVCAQSESYQLSTHILDINKGKPAEGVSITLYQQTSIDQWKEVETGITDANGRILNFLPDNRDNSGTYMLKFYTQPYFQKQNLKSIYPFVEIIFKVEGKGHYHIPITPAANGYSTYRGN